MWNGHGGIGISGIFSMTEFDNDGRIYVNWKEWGAEVLKTVVAGTLTATIAIVAEKISDGSLKRGVKELFELFKD